MATPAPFTAFAPLLRSLKVKFVAAMILIVGVVIGLSTWWNLQVHRAHMVKATEDRVRALADAIDRRIYTVMREGHIQDLQRILEDAGQDPDIERIMIFDLQGKRDLAVAQYTKVLGMKEYKDSAGQARRYLAAPYSR